MLVWKDLTNEIIQFVELHQSWQKPQYDKRKNKLYEIEKIFSEYTFTIDERKRAKEILSNAYKHPTVKNIDNLKKFIKNHRLDIEISIKGDDNSQTLDEQIFHYKKLKYNIFVKQGICYKWSWTGTKWISKEIMPPWEI